MHILKWIYHNDKCLHYTNLCLLCYNGNHYKCHTMNNAASAIIYRNAHPSSSEHKTPKTHLYNLTPNHSYNVNINYRMPSNFFGYSFSKKGTKNEPKHLVVTGSRFSFHIFVTFGPFIKFYGLPKPIGNRLHTRSKSSTPSPLFHPHVARGQRL